MVPDSERRTVLVVDDDPSVVALMGDFLEAAGYRVCTACEADGALSVVRDQHVDCVVLDLMMPGSDGFSVCRRLREHGDIPILILTARDSDVDKIRGLSLGADDFIVKTASPGEVVARTKAVLRRSAPTPPVRRRHGRLIIDPMTREVLVDNEPVSLSPKEYDLLLWFSAHPRQVLRYDHLLDTFWDGVGDKHTVRVHIGRLRDKIERDPDHPALLINVWGVGYRFDGERA